MTQMTTATRVSGIEGLWFVTTPTAGFTLADILWFSTWADLRLQFLGGLTSGEIVGAFQSQADAFELATRLLAEV